MKGKEPKNPMPLLRDRLHGLESDAPGLGWDSFQRHRKKRRLIVWWYAGFVLLALVTSAALFTGYRKSNEKKAQLTTTPAAAPRLNLIPDQEKNTLLSARSDEALPPETKPNRLQFKELSDFKPVSPDPNLLPDLPVSPQDTYLLVALRLRPIARLPELVLRPQNRLLPLPSPGLKPILADSWQWHWGLCMGAGLFKPVTQVTASGEGFIHRDYSAIRRKFEVGLFSQNLRLQTAATKGNWMFTAGIGIHRQLSQANYDFVYSEAPVIDRDGRIIAYAAAIPQRIAFNSTHYLTSAELPVSVAWRFRSARDYSLYLRLGATPSFIGSIKGNLPDPVLLDRREKLSPVNYRISSQAFSLALPLLLRTSTNGRLELCPEWKWHSGLRQTHGHYLSRYNQTGITCSYYVRF